MPEQLATRARHLHQLPHLRPGSHRAARSRLVAVPALLMLLVAGCGEAPDQEQQSAGEPSPEERATATDGADPTAAAGDESGDSEDSPQTFTFVSFEFGYEPAPEKVPPGEHVFRLENDGALTHDVTIEELGDQTVVEASGGDTAEGRVTLEPGTYTYYCDEPGHRVAGMEGTLEVAEPAS